MNTPNPTAITSPPRPDQSRGRAWAYLGALLGGAVSVAANVAHSYVPPPGVVQAGPMAVDSWHPHLGAVVGAVFWPVALAIAVEIFARITWPQARRWTALRFLGLLPVALVAAIVSYRHLSGLLHFYGEDPLTTIIGPLAVDGLMIMASGALVATSGRATSAPIAAPAEQGAPEECADHAPGLERAAASDPGTTAASPRPVVEPSPPQSPAPASRVPGGARPSRPVPPLPVPVGAFTRTNGTQLSLPGVLS